MRDTFSVERVARALGAGPVAAVEVIEALQASANQVARLTVRFADGRALGVIGKAARGAGVAGVRRELAYFEHIAPEGRAPALLGADDDGDALVLLTEDRPARDLAMRRHYWHALQARGVTGYSWALCHWDLRLSLIHNALQSLFQADLTWLRHSLAAIDAHDARAARCAPPQD